MVSVQQLREVIIRPSLQVIGMNGHNAEELLVGTCAQETLGISFLKQKGHGPGLGIYSMEKDTHDDIWVNYLNFRPTLKSAVLKAVGLQLSPPAELLNYNMMYATIMARLAYARHSEKLPEAGNVNEMAIYWKRFYNTVLGEGNESQFVANYHRFIGDTKLN